MTHRNARLQDLRKRGNRSRCGPDRASDVRARARGRRRDGDSCGSAPLIETATSSASETLGSQEVRELPVNRRNVANLLSLAPGVSVGGSAEEW